MYNWEELTRVVTGRNPDMFLRDIQNNLEHIRKYKRALFIGGAGTIGLATIKEFMRYGALEHIGIVDQDENAMAEAIRSVRNRSTTIGLEVVIADVRDQQAWSCVKDWSKYDIVLWFAAMKHVRSERDLIGCQRMLDVNYWSLLYGHGRFFYCSTDKASDPVSVLGASKRLGEDAALRVGGTCARFANVAFSNGSLLQSWMYRMAENQPLPVPRGIKRYLISPAEAGRICLLAATWKEAGTVLVPLMNQPTLLEEACRWFALHFGYQGGITVTDADTSGEKETEEFNGEQEEILAAGLQINRVIPQSNIDLDKWGGLGVGSKEELISMLKEVIPNFRHKETGKSLDARA